MFERDNGRWKIVYLNYLLAGITDRKPAR